MAYQPHCDAVGRGEIRCSPSGSGGDQNLMLEQLRFRGDGANAARAEQLRERGQQMNRKDAEFAHEGTLPRRPERARLSRTFANSGLLGIRHLHVRRRRTGRTAFLCN